MPRNDSLHKNGERTVVETKRFQHLPSALFQLELVPCGKPSCRRCPHGPYWYRYEWVRGKGPNGGRMRSSYVGKKLALTWED